MTEQPVLRILVTMMSLLVLVLLGCCGYQYAVSTTLARDTVAARQQRARTQQETAQRRRALAASTTLTERIPAQPASWSWSEQLPAMMTQVSRLAKDSGAAVETIQPAPPVTNNGVTRFPLRVTLHGNLTALTRMLEQVRQVKPLLAIDKISLRPGAKPGEPMLIELTVAAYTVTGTEKPAATKPVSRKGATP